MICLVVMLYNGNSHMPTNAWPDTNTVQKINEKRNWNITNFINIFYDDNREFDKCTPNEKAVNKLEELIDECEP